MSREEMKRFTLREYKGCGVQPASFRVGEAGWFPEAAFWLYTDKGWRRLWVASFAHCLRRAEMTFPSRIDADQWAYHLARELIDRMLTNLAGPLRIDNAESQVSAAPLLRLFASRSGRWRRCHPFRFRH
jgi:hypothetical protein